MTAVSVSVIPYVTVAARAPSFPRYSATNLVGNGMNATTSRKPTVSIRNVRSARSIWFITVWWFAQMIPIVRKLTTYATYDGHAASSAWRRSSPIGDPTCGIDADDEERRGDREHAVGERLEPVGLHVASQATRRCSVARRRGRRIGTRLRR